MNNVHFLKCPMSWESSSYGHASLFPRLFPHSFSISSSSSTSSDHQSLSDTVIPSGYCTPIMHSPSFPQTGFNALNQSHNEEEDKKRGKGALRRYKTPSPQILRQRRCAANERERKRMTTLNTAYDKLRTVLPEYDSGRRLSKFDTLRMAQEYIAHLEKILNSPISSHYKREQ